MRDATFVLAMTGSEQKLVSCLGFARRLAKRMQLFDVQSHLDQAPLHLTQVEDKKLATITQRFPICLSELIPNEHFAEVAESGTQTLERMVTETEVAGLLEALEGSVAKMMEKRLQPLDSMQEALEAKMIEQAQQGELIHQMQVSIHELTQQLPLPQCVAADAHPFNVSGHGSPQQVASSTHSFLSPMDMSHLRCMHRLRRFTFLQPSTQNAPVNMDCSKP